MIIENIFWDFELGYNLVEYEECYILPIVFNGKHGLWKFSELIHDHNDMLMCPR